MLKIENSLIVLGRNFQEDFLLKIYKKKYLINSNKGFILQNLNEFVLLSIHLPFALNISEPSKKKLSFLHDNQGEKYN